MSIRSSKTAYLNEIPDEQLACRAGRHDWPVLVPGRKLPQNFRVARERDGVFQLTEICGRCGEERTMTTLPRGVFDMGAVYAYKYPKDWVRVPRDVELSRRDCVAENLRRCLPNIREAALPD